MTTPNRPDETSVDLTKPVAEAPPPLVPLPHAAPQPPAQRPASRRPSSQRAGSQGPGSQGHGSQGPLFEKVAAPAERPAAPAGPAWIVVPARIIALVFVLPFRLLYDLLRWTGRGLTAGMALLGAVLLWPFARLYRHVLRPIGHGIAWLADVLVVRPIRWLAVVVVWGFLRMFGRGSGKLGRWFHRRVLAPIGAGLLAVWNGLIWLLNVLVVVPATVVGRGLWWLLSGSGRIVAAIAGAIGTGIAWLVATLVVLPLVLLWRYLLRPPLAGLLWVGRWIGFGLMYVGRGIGTGLLAGWRAFAGAVSWSWRWSGRILRRLGRVLFVIPAVALWRYVLAPICHGIAEGARMAGRVLRWLWRTLVVAPARLVRDVLLIPTGRAIRGVWRVTVRDPLRWVNASVIAPVRATGRDVRLQLRQAFRRG
ncbi:hypothetical protein [Spirillospora sp. NPDC047279]|uniref:hypothetical protein n=1 Tax=Spirillospora sp. NPDC047279 TaxID=3155478 RepID=UPI0033E55A42